MAGRWLWLCTRALKPCCRTCLAPHAEAVTVLDTAEAVSAFAQSQWCVRRTLLCRDRAPTFCCSAQLDPVHNAHGRLPPPHQTLAPACPVSPLAPLRPSPPAPACRTIDTEMQGAIANEGVRLPATAINLTDTGLSDKTFAYSSSKGAIVDMSWSGAGPLPGALPGALPALAEAAAAAAAAGAQAGCRRCASRCPLQLPLQELPSFLRTPKRAPHTHEKPNQCCAMMHGTTKP